jgi:hypothetical protein
VQILILILWVPFLSNNYGNYLIGDIELINSLINNAVKVLIWYKYKISKAHTQYIRIYITVDMDVKDRQLSGEIGIDAWLDKIELLTGPNYESSILSLGVSMTTAASVKRVLQQKSKMLGAFAKDLFAYVHIKHENIKDDMRYGCNVFRELCIVLKCFTLGTKTDITAFLSPEYTMVKSLFQLIQKICCQRSVLLLYHNHAVANRQANMQLELLEVALHLLVMVAEVDDKQRIQQLRQANQVPGLHNITAVMGRRLFFLQQVSTGEHKEVLHPVVAYFAFINRVLEQGNCDGLFDSVTKPKGTKERVHHLFHRKYTVYCSAPECPEKTHIHPHYKKCSLCALSQYCSKKCQQSHWTNGHKTACLRVRY